MSFRKLINSVKGSEKEIRRAIGNFKGEKCDNIINREAKGLSGQVKALCENPTYYTNNMFQTLYRALDTYDMVLNNRIAPSGPQLMNLYRQLLMTIYRYIVVSMYFALRPSYFIPKSGVEELKFRQEFKKYFLELNLKLLGCKAGEGFAIQQIADPLSQEDTYKNILNYFNEVCNTIRIELLKT